MHYTRQGRSHVLVATRVTHWVPCVWERSGGALWYAGRYLESWGFPGPNIRLMSRMQGSHRVVPLGAGGKIRRVSRCRSILLSSSGFNINRLENRLGILCPSNSSKGVLRVPVLRTTAECKYNSCSKFFNCLCNQARWVQWTNCNQIFYLTMFLKLETILELWQKC